MSASAETLMNQAGYTAEHWMKQAIESIDGMFGEGYAKKNPELISGFMIAASNDQLAMYISKLKDNE